MVLGRQIRDLFDSPLLDERSRRVREELRLLARALESNPAFDRDSDAEHRHEQQDPEDRLRQRGHGRENVDEIERHAGLSPGDSGSGQRMRNEKRAMRTTAWGEPSTMIGWKR